MLEIINIDFCVTINLGEKNMPLAQELLTFGLSNKEADVYVAALQLGFSTVQELAQKATINRTTAYTQIKNLIARGLIKVVEKYGKLYYVAESPDYLCRLQEQQEKEVARRKEVLANILPELESIYNLAVEKPTVKYYDYNPESLNRIRLEIEATRVPEMCNIFNYDRYAEFINKKHVEGILNIVNKFKVIYISKTKALDARVCRLQNNEKFCLKYLPSDKFGFLCEVLIAGPKVYIAREKDSLIISDTLLAQTMGLLFQALWGIAETI
ncbi:MAG: Transcriptional regulator, TrmB [Parcubacteria group bacterium GW2011_GWC2_39_14]|nr:MAG: Transcriptional regulator, TrmB [Parcubacteria group bacterium GW2011_GWC2_39_14]